MSLMVKQMYLDEFTGGRVSLDQLVVSPGQVGLPVLPLGLLAPSGHHSTCLSELCAAPACCCPARLCLIPFLISLTVPTI